MLRVGEQESLVVGDLDYDGDFSREIVVEYLARPCGFTAGGELSIVSPHRIQSILFYKSEVFGVALIFNSMTRYFILPVRPVRPEDRYIETSEDLYILESAFHCADVALKVLLDFHATRGQSAVALPLVHGGELPFNKTTNASAVYLSVAERDRIVSFRRTNGEWRLFFGSELARPRS